MKRPRNSRQKVASFHQKLNREKSGYPVNKARTTDNFFKIMTGYTPIVRSKRLELDEESNKVFPFCNIKWVVLLNTNDN